jgi:TNF receptor-associated factor 4
MKKDLDEHLENDCPNRDHKCEYCGEEGTYATITEVHDKICKMKPVPCPNDECEKEIQRQQISEHVSKCPHTVIPCKYKGIGCATKMKRQDMPTHEQDDQLHLHMALETVNKLQLTANSLQATLNLLLPKAFALSEYQEKKDAGERFQLPPFYTHPNGYRMGVEVYANGYGDGEGTHVSVRAIIFEGEHDAGLKWPFIGKVTFTLLNQLEDDHHHSNFVYFGDADTACVGCVMDEPKFMPHSALVADHPQYLKDDTLYFQVEVEEVADRKPWLGLGLGL